MTPRQAPRVGATSRVVGTNCATQRAGAGLTLAELSERLNTIGHPLGPATLSELERGARRATVDDLTAISAALGVSPITLLLPASLTGDQEPMELTGATAEVGWQMLEWLRGEGPLSDWGTDDPQEQMARETFRRHALPPWAWHHRLQ